MCIEPRFVPGGHASPKLAAGRLMPVRATFAGPGRPPARSPATGAQQATLLL